MEYSFSIHTSSHASYIETIHSSTRYTHQSTHSSIHHSIYLLIYSLFHAPSDKSIYLSTHLSFHLSIHPFIYPPIYSSFHLSIHSSIHPATAHSFSAMCTQCQPTVWSGLETLLFSYIPGESAIVEVEKNLSEMRTGSVLLRMVNIGGQVLLTFTQALQADPSYFFNE